MGERESSGYDTRIWTSEDESDYHDWGMDGEESDNVYDGWLEGEESVNEVEYEGMSGGGEVVNVMCRDEDERFDKGEKYGSDQMDEMARYDSNNVAVIAGCKHSEEDEEWKEQRNTSECV